MAKELRHELVRTIDVDGAGDSLAEFRNDTSVDIHIRELDAEAVLTTAALGEISKAELSKAPVYQGVTNNSPFWRWGITVGNPGNIAIDSNGATVNRGKRYGRGQLVLEPNESIFLNAGGQIGAPTINVGFEIGYEF